MARALVRNAFIYHRWVRCSYHPGYSLPVPAGHSFPASKFVLLKELLLAAGILAADDLMQPEPVDMATLARIHTSDYLAKLANGSLSAVEQRRLGFPWSDSLWMRSRLATGGTLLAARVACQEGLAGNLAGGTHHAFADHGEGFCVVNDVAVTIATLRAERRIQRALVIDLDVHQGNATAAIFADTPDIFTFSMHADRNYPLQKTRSSLDIALADRSGDHEYLETLRRHLPGVLSAAAADLVFYVAGVDVAAGDRFGKLALSDAGIRRRERLVVESVRDLGLPLVIVLGGGYAASRARTAELHALVFREAVAYERKHAPGRPYGGTLSPAVPPEDGVAPLP